MEYDAFIALHRGSLETMLTDGLSAMVAARPQNPVAFLTEYLTSISNPTVPPPAPAREKSTEIGSWSAEKWLESAGVLGCLADSLVGDAASSDELAAVRALARSITDESVLRASLRASLAAGLDSVVNLLLPRLRELAVAESASSEELHSKFADAGAYELKHLGLTAFFAGLEGMIGSPSPGSVDDVMESMEAEHKRGPESNETFKTGNYGLDTTSAIEWAFVVAPEAPPAPLVAWPAEKINTSIVEDGRQQSVMREPRPVSKLADAMEKVNTELHATDEPQLVWAETVAGCLYTGPVFFKYNAVLRGLD